MPDQQPKPLPRRRGFLLSFNRLTIFLQISAQTKSYMTLISYIKDQRRILLRRLRLRPVNTVFRKLNQYGWKKFPSGLEVFGHTGEYHTMNYQHLVDDLHVWEFRQECEQPLKSNLPGAKIRITDSYKEIRAIDKKFDLVVIDNHQGIFGDGYCEHFEMLPLAFPVLKKRAVVIVNVLPNLDELRKMYPGDYTEHLERRSKWYRTSNPIQPGEKFLLDFYTKYATAAGFRLDFIFITKRNKVVSYLSMGLSNPGVIKIFSGRMITLIHTNLSIHDEILT